MKCQKCTKSAIVHLTEVISSAEGKAQEKRTAEIHLCLHHAVEAGLLAPPEEPSKTISIKPETGKGGSETASAGQTESQQQISKAIVPAGESTNLPATRERAGQAQNQPTCAVCGMNWTQFKQSGLMGCPHDYQQFSDKLLPLLRRAQEGATEHLGKVPAKIRSQSDDREIRSLRLRKELQRAVDAENYEQAAQLRDKLRQLEHN